MSKLVRRRARETRDAIDELWNGVVSARTERVTAENSSDGEPAATHRAMLLECLDRIRRAAGHIAAARRQHRRQRHLVAANQQNEKYAHESIYCGELRRDSCRLASDRLSQSGELFEAQLVR